jgi:hypothetical protein
MRANSRYLTLALDVRKITDSLIRLAEKGQEGPDLPEILPRILASLDANGEGTAVQRLRASGSFGNYENIVTVNEVFEKPEDRTTVIQQIQQVLNAATPEERRNSAAAAIPYLDAIERRALYRYSRPQVDRRVAIAR